MVSVQDLVGKELLGPRAGGGSAPNVGEAERWLSVLGGGFLALQGLRRGTLAGLGLAAVGGGLIYRGLSGHSHVYGALGLDTRAHGPATSVRAGQGYKVACALTIGRPPEELYRFWRNFENLPRIMPDLLSVKVEGNRSHWVARGPAGSRAEWDAEIHNEEPNRLIAWRSLEGSQVDTAGSVHFTPAPGGRGTEVRVTLKYDPPVGGVGRLAAWLSAQDPERQVRESLRRFKQLMEAGEVPTVEGQTSCRGS
jgi:uncharacterized membrane protein